MTHAYHHLVVSKVDAKVDTIMNHIIIFKTRMQPLRNGKIIYKLLKTQQSTHIRI